MGKPLVVSRDEFRPVGDWIEEGELSHLLASGMAVMVDDIACWSPESMGRASVLSIPFFRGRPLTFGEEAARG